MLFLSEVLGYGDERTTVREGDYTWIGLTNQELVALQKYIMVYQNGLKYQSGLAVPWFAMAEALEFPFSVFSKAKGGE
jgi:hypothetical protein